MPKFKPRVQINVSDDGKNWVVLNPNNQFDDFCFTVIHLDTLAYKYLSVIQSLKPRKKGKKSK